MFFLVLSLFPVFHADSITNPVPSPITAMDEEKVEPKLTRDDVARLLGEEIIDSSQKETLRSASRDFDRHNALTQKMKILVSVSENAFQNNHNIPFVKSDLLTVFGKHEDYLKLVKYDYIASFPIERQEQMFKYNSMYTESFLKQYGVFIKCAAKPAHEFWMDFNCFLQICVHDAAPSISKYTAHNGSVTFMESVSILPMHTISILDSLIDYALKVFHASNIRNMELVGEAAYTLLFHFMDHIWGFGTTNISIDKLLYFHIGMVYDTMDDLILNMRKSPRRKKQHRREDFEYTPIRKQRNLRKRD